MGISLWHILVVLLIVLIVFGAGKLPKVMGDLGKGIRSFKSGMDGKDDNADTKSLPGDRKTESAMFDIGWPELFVVAAVALVAIGPKDLPKAMHAIGRWAGKMRALAHNWQSTIDRLAYEAEIADKLEKEGDHAGKRPGNEPPPQ